MPLVNIKNFGNGIAEDYANPRSGEFSIVKHFDVLTFPNRLHPLRGMTTTGEPTNSLLGNIIVASNGLFYGIGEDPGNAGKGELWTKAGFGTTDFWRQMTSSRQLSGQGVQYNFLVDYQNAGGVRKIFWSGINILVVSDEDGNSSADTDALSHINIRQGIVHPKDKILYFTYNTSTQYFIGKIDKHSSDPFGNTNYTAFELPFNDVAHTLSYFGDFLAVPLTNLNPGGDVQSSKLGLWDRDTSQTTFNQTITWGGSLRVINNLNGVLIGISQQGSGGDAFTQDMDKILIKGYVGGSAPFVIKEIRVPRLTSTKPRSFINTRVNFIHNNRMYFSISLVGGGTAPAYYGLWSVGLNKEGVWTVNLERMATDDSSETNVLAAGMKGDYVTMVHTAKGTITRTNVTDNLANIYTATSVYESGINPKMIEDDKRYDKTLEGVYANYLPLPDAGSVTVEYRVDTDADGTWIKIFTETDNGKTLTEAVTELTNKTQFKSGVNYEFRITCTGGAIITGFGYKYSKNASQL